MSSATSLSGGQHVPFPTPTYARPGRLQAIVPAVDTSATWTAASPRSADTRTHSKRRRSGSPKQSILASPPTRSGRPSPIRSPQPTEPASTVPSYDALPPADRCQSKRPPQHSRTGSSTPSASARRRRRQLCLDDPSSRHRYLPRDPRALAQPDLRQPSGPVPGDEQGFVGTPSCHTFCSAGPRTTSASRKLQPAARHCAARGDTTFHAKPSAAA